MFAQTRFMTSVLTVVRYATKGGMRAGNLMRKSDSLETDEALGFRCNIQYASLMFNAILVA